MSATSRVSGLPSHARYGLAALGLVVALGLALSGCERKSQPSVAGPAEPGARGKIGLLPEGAAKPNIIMILVDALRPDRLGAYGNRGRLSPTIDSMAAAGVTFDLCVSAAPWTLPSVGTLFTSYYPGVHKATSYRAVASMEDGRQAQQSVLPDEFETLAEVLQEDGYQTAGFVAAKFLRAGYGFGQGFDHYDTAFAENTVRGETVNQALFKWLDEDREASKPLFLYLHYMDVHGPYNAAPRFMDPLMEQVEENPNKRLLESREFKAINAYLKEPPPESSDPTRYERLKAYREYWEARYEAGVAEVDFHLAQLVKRLQERGLWDDSYVILLADHGEALCEHGLWEHGYSQYQTDLRVPLILRWPGVLPAGKRVRQLASLIDLMPTLLEQLRLPPGENLQGTSLVDHISGTLPDTPLVRFAEAIKAGPYQFAFFADYTKLLATPIAPRKLPDGTTSEGQLRQQLFNLATDPEEQYDVAAQNQEVVGKLTKLLERTVRINSGIKPGLVTQRKPVDQQTMGKLESLGYVGATDEDANEPQPESQPTSAPGRELGEDEGKPDDRP